MTLSTFAGFADALGADAVLDARPRERSYGTLVPQRALPPEGDSMLLELALYASTAHANVPPYDLDLLYHDGRAHSLDKRFLIWLPPFPRRERTLV
jgi:hypothetical protein